MTPLRFSMLTATLLAFAATVHGQAPAPPPPNQCPASPGFFSTNLQHSMEFLQQLRSFCTGQSCDKGGCASAAVGSPGCCKVGAVKVEQAPASCCGAKACGCCETCKEKKSAAHLPKVGEVMIPAPCVLIKPRCAYLYVPPSPLTPPAVGQVGIALPQACPYPPASVLPMPSQPLRIPAGTVPTCVTIQQVDRDLKIAEFYLRTGHPGAAQFYYDLVMRRYGPVMPPMAAPHVVALTPCAPPAYMMAPPMPVPPAPPMTRQIVQVQALAAQPMYAPPPAVIVADCPVASPALKHAHLVTPDFEAHCHHMTHRGDTIILEGDVILLNKKHAQPMRIEGHRVIVNMKDGTFTVESEARPTVSGFGVQRTSAVAPVVHNPAEERCVHLIRVRHANASELSTLIARRIANGHLSLSDVKLNADPISNMIRVEAATKDVPVVSQMVTELDKAPQPQQPARSKAVVMTLKNMDASQAAVTLQRLLLGHGDVRLTVDDETNSIIIRVVE